MSVILIAIVMIGVFVFLLVLIGHYHQGSSAELVDWKPTRSPQVEAENEVRDIQQMLEAQNEIRRRRGAPEIDEAELRAEVEAEELERLRWRER